MDRHLAVHKFIHFDVTQESVAKVWPWTFFMLAVQGLACLLSKDPSWVLLGGLASSGNGLVGDASQPIALVDAVTASQGMRPEMAAARSLSPLLASRDRPPETAS